MILSREIVDENRNNEGIFNSRFLEVIINRNEQELQRLSKLMAYYRGEHNILERKRKSKGLYNYKTVMNYAKYITTMATAFLIGEPVTYSVSDGFNIDELKAVYYDQNIADLDSALGTDASIFGRAMEYIYVDEENHPKSCKISPLNAFVVRDDTAEHKKIIGVRYHKKFDLNGAEVGSVAYISDDKMTYVYEGTNFASLSEKPKQREEHYFGQVPLIEILNNEQEQGDFEQQIADIDAYNILMSDRVNDKAQFVDSFLLLLGIDVDTETAKKLKEEKILMGDVDGDGKYLSKVLSESDTEILRKALKDDIHTSAMVPDLTDEAFAGNLSGVAIKYKMRGLEVLALSKEKLFRKGLQERVEAYQYFLNIRNNTAIVPTHRIDITFHYTSLNNGSEQADIVSKLHNIVSEETLFGELDFVTDAKEEAKLAAHERKEKQKVTREIMDGYISPIKTSGDEK